MNLLCEVEHGSSFIQRFVPTGWKESIFIHNSSVALGFAQSILGAQNLLTHCLRCGRAVTGRLRRRDPLGNRWMPLTARTTVRRSEPPWREDRAQRRLCCRQAGGITRKDETVQRRLGGVKRLALRWLSRGNGVGSRSCAAF